ncbi:uncharacterized protein [Onthophagus taurus]|uniref:uncharacterized protein n=1 Tax=Onthophagus taurus TaxID=166361 RepID=UPI000C203B46|nr:uncharacterized protein LOC111413789 [Onthophagus taurus]
MLRFILLLVFLLTVRCENEYERDIYWRHFNKVIPEDAVDVGFGVYVGISLLDGYMIPGTINPESGKFEGVLSRKHEKTDEVKILCSKNPLRFKWLYINGTDLPPNLPILSKRFVKLDSNSRTYYVGRAFHENQWRIGTVYSPAMKIFYTWNNDRTVRQLNHYEILTYITPDNMVYNNPQQDVSSDLKTIKELLNKNNYFILSVAAEIDLLPEPSKDLVKSAIWRIIYTVKRAKVTNSEISLSNLTKQLRIE